MKANELPTARTGEIVLYEAKDKAVQIEARLAGDTIWLNRQQMASLFGRDVKTIGKHIGNALSEELRDFSVVANFATTASDGKTYQVAYYNLDMILSVGYRVKSSEGVHFRRWATAVLKRHVLQGYTVNEKRLAQLNKVIDIISRSASPEIAGISGVLAHFTSGLRLLDQYDRQTLSKPGGSKPSWRLTYDEARTFIDSMRLSEESVLFGKEKDESFKSALGAIYQTFDGVELYPGTQEKAANLLYLTVKNHAFFDGNKRIAAALFVYFLDRNKALLDDGGQPLVSSNALAAMTLMIALSQPEEKESMCLMVMNMIERC